MCNFLETNFMYNRRDSLYMANKVFILLAVIISITVITGAATAKSLYVLSNIDANPNPLQVYDIAKNGTLTFQNEYYLPRYNNGSLNLAIDSDSGYLFVTYSSWGRIILVEPNTMTTITEMTSVSGAWDLSGIVYNHKKKQLYCVDRGRRYLWVYDWNPDTIKLTLVQGAPFRLDYATAYGIALDEVDQLLYVTNSTDKVYVYSTTDWSLKRTITLDRAVMCAAVDVKNGYLYTGGGYIGNPYLTQYHLSSNAILETLVEPAAAAGVIAISVDPNSSRVYFTTGNYVIPGGDNIRIYDRFLHPIDFVKIDGNPTGLVIPGKEIGYNPLNLEKTVLKVVNYDGSDDDSVDAQDLVTYRIKLSNQDNTYTVTDVQIVDHLPNEVTFISASDNGEFGSYDPVTHTYTWLYATLVTDSTACLDITVRVNSDVPPRTSIVNSVTVNSNTTPQTTTSTEIITASNPLNIKKTIFGASEGQTKWVDVNEVITYNIHVDNNDNEFSVTDVIITDTLPEDLIYLKADDDYFGIYDANSHTFTWSMPSLDPQEEVDLGITVRLHEDALEGATVTNTVTAQSVETAMSESSIDIRVGEGPVLINDGNIQVIPGTVRRDSALASIMVIVEMPLGYKAKDIKNTPLLLSLVDDSGVTVRANDNQIITESLGKTYVIAIFDKWKVMDAIPGYGPKDIEISGTLANEGLFAGYATINITMFAGN